MSELQITYQQLRELSGIPLERFLLLVQYMAGYPFAKVQNDLVPGPQLPMYVLVFWYCQTFGDSDTFAILNHCLTLQRDEQLDNEAALCWLDAHRIAALPVNERGAAAQRWAVVFPDETRLTMGGWAGFLDLQTGERIDKLPFAPISFVTLNLGALYLQTQARWRLLVEKEDNAPPAPDCPAG